MPERVRYPWSRGKRQEKKSRSTTKTIASKFAPHVSIPWTFKKHNVPNGTRPRNVLLPHQQVLAEFLDRFIPHCLRSVRALLCASKIGGGGCFVFVQLKEAHIPRWIVLASTQQNESGNICAFV